MNNKDLPAMPLRIRHDWAKAKIGQCDCGYHGSLVDGMCADCHDTEYHESREQVLIDRIIELQSVGTGLTKREYFAAHAPEMPNEWLATQEFTHEEAQDDANGVEGVYFRYRIRCMIAWRWHYADMMLESEK